MRSSEYLMLEDYLSAGLIKTHRTKKDAQAYAKAIGWAQYNVFKFERRFEDIWIVAQHPIQPTVIGGLEFDVYRCPTGIYELKNRSNQMVVLEVKKYIKKTA